MTRADMESATPKRQSLRAASVKLPAELSASIGVGATLGAMMGDQSLRKA
jgi:F0F1-type ATP synthase assembly protein I